MKKMIKYYNSYDIVNLSHNEWNKDIKKHNEKYYGLLNKKEETEIFDLDIITELIHNNYNFWVKVINEEPYKKTNTVMIELTLTYINKPITLYITKDIMNMLTNKPQKEEVSLHWYEYRLRGFSPFCQPKGHIEVNHNIGRHGIIAYDRPLTQKEISDYELTPYEQELQTTV